MARDQASAPVSPSAPFHFTGEAFIFVGNWQKLASLLPLPMLSLFFRFASDHAGLAQFPFTMFNSLEIFNSFSFLLSFFVFKASFLGLGTFIHDIIPHHSRNTSTYSFNLFPSLLPTAISASRLYFIRILDILSLFRHGAYPAHQRQGIFEWNHRPSTTT